MNKKTTEALVGFLKQVQEESTKIASALGAISAEQKEASALVKPVAEKLAGLKYSDNVPLVPEAQRAELVPALCKQASALSVLGDLCDALIADQQSRISVAPTAAKTASHSGNLGIAVDRAGVAPVAPARQSFLPSPGGQNRFRG